MNKFIPTHEQELIIRCNESAIIDAGPGTGKTRTAIEKAFFEISNMDKESNKFVLFLSFSNASLYRLMSASKLKFTRLERKRVRFRTYHSAAFEILKNYGRFVGLPSTIRVMDSLEEKLVALENGWDSSAVDYYDQLIQFAQKHGMLSFSVILPLAKVLMESSPKLQNIINRIFHLIIVDEFQDTSEEQWSFLKCIGGNGQVIAFGDPNQIIYSSLHKATENRFNEFCEWKQIDMSEFSNANFRCDNAQILQFARSLLKGEPFQADDNSNVEFANINYRNRLVSSLSIIWKNFFDSAEKAQNIGFLAPNNKIAEDAAIALRSPSPTAKVKIPVYAKVAKDEAAYDSVILALAAVKDFAITKEELSAKKAALALLAMDLSWNTRKKPSTKKIEIVKKMLIKNIDDSSTKLGNLFISCPIECNLNSLLPPFVEALGDLKEFKTSSGRITAHDRIKFNGSQPSDPQLLLFDELRTERKPKGLEGYDISEGKTHILNYHKAKGREFDYVVGRSRYAAEKKLK